MKKLSLLLVAAVTILLTGCLDTVEDITIAKNGSGVYSSTMDMSGMFDMLEMMAAMDTSANSKLKMLADKNIDSVINMSVYTDTAAGLTTEQKQLFRSAKLHMVINQQKKLCKMEMNFPFNKPEDVKQLMQLSQNGKGLSLLGNQGNSGPAMGGMDPDEAQMPSPSDVFDINIHDGLVERKLNEEKYNALKQNEKFKEMSNAGQMLDAITFHTNIHLPREAKNVQGKRTSLSADKKTVTLDFTMADLVNDPGAIEYRIEY